ncbi:hypothetical protein [Marinobacterium iners]|uniref:Gamma-glutamyl cyclotransferase, AIG2-like n=1 Tax=Marinobacterium iners DSM 11526 TaxID=1122198 RepID=A0A1H4E6G6_9GAMM|nr:hypothetical protein [Marinobacterium iners]SEA80635.1 hypothetical protein SAMN02745729_107177 [Marinobacterium iners DSM 11526]
MSTIGILAYGSLIEDPGIELEPLIFERKEGIQTPFNIEFARTSSSRGGAPTVVPVENIGSPVSAVILMLSNDLDVDAAKDLLWRRETRNEKSKKHYSNPVNPTVNQVVVEEVRDFHGVDLVLFTKIGANIDAPTAVKLATLAIESARGGAGADRKDGISYLISLKRQNISTPLMHSYESTILQRLGVKTLEEAYEAARQNV